MEGFATPPGVDLPPAKVLTRAEVESHLEWIRLTVVRALAAGVAWDDIEVVFNGCRQVSEHRMSMLRSSSP